MNVNKDGEWKKARNIENKTKNNFILELEVYHANCAQEGR